MKVFPFLMAGGLGTRLWPSSRAACPKQFLALSGPDSMLVQTLLRIAPLGFQPPAIICQQAHRFLVAEHARRAGIRPGEIILEAAGRGTAFTVALSALIAADQDPQGIVFCLPCDQAIGDDEAYRRAAVAAAQKAEAGELCIFAVSPRGPETGYGYIEGDGAGRVLSFREKPDRATAESYLRTGRHLWNAGMFMFPARTIIAALELHAPKVLRAAEDSLNGAEPDLDFVRLPEGPLAHCPQISIDVAVLEKAEEVAYVSLDTPWSDLGSWKSVHAHWPKDNQGNAIRGEGVIVESSGCLLFAPEGVSVAALGLKDIAVIAEPDAILVMDLARAESVTTVTRLLAERGSDKHDIHMQVWRPWGHYTVLGRGPGYLMKRLEISPGARLSLQYHNHRAEHWVVVQGEIEVQKEDEIFTLKVNQSVYIPIGARHRIANAGDTPAVVIEVQTGEVLEESDIVRLEDLYKRA